MSGKSKAEEVLQDNPDAMHDLMQKIRSDPNYITSLYKDCPGMRQVLDEHPDLKKIFENPDILRRSFEAVYIKNGGEPEPVDEDDSDCECLFLCRVFPDHSCDMFALSLKLPCLRLLVRLHVQYEFLGL